MAKGVEYVQPKQRRPRSPVAEDRGRQKLICLLAQVIAGPLKTGRSHYTD